MLNKLFIAILFPGIAIFIFSCSSKTISTKYYYQNEKVLDRIEEKYKKLNQQNPFTVAFTNRKFNTISLEIITDTLTYIYQFKTNDKHLADTLIVYQLNAPEIIELIQLMQSIHCTWVNEFTYYVDEKKHELIFMSIKPVSMRAPFSSKRYYTLTYFPQPQYFDSAGQLLDKRKLQSLRKINGEIFHRIDNKVCYTLTGNFR